MEPQRHVSDLWTRLLDASDGLERPAILRTPLSTAVFSQDDFREVIQRIQSPDLPGEPRIRAYVTGRHCDRFAARIRSESLAPDESIESWLCRLAGDAHPGLVINEAERWSDGIARRAAQLVRPLVQQFASPQLAVEIALFVGDYGYTPFGAHRDDVHHRTLHFHVGPNSKRFIIWDKPVYEALTGAATNHYDPASIAGHGTPYDVSRGDVFLLPPHNYHVGQTLGFSMDVAIILSKVTKKQALREAGEQALRRMIASEPDASSTALRPEPVDYLAIRTTPDDDFKTWLDRAVDEFSLLRASNAGLRFPSFERHPVDAGALARGAVQLVAPFQIATRVHGGSLTLYARHQRIQLRHASALVDLVQLLNTGDRLRVADLVGRFRAGLAADALLAVLTQLVVLGAITLSKVAGHDA